MKKYLLFALFLYLGVIAKAQNVGIGTLTPNANAKLEVADSVRGMLIPRMDSIHRKNISNTVGLLVYDLSTKSFWYNDGVIWHNLNANSSSNSQLGKIIYILGSNKNISNSIYIANYDGSNQTKINITVPGVSINQFINARLSPDGTKIFFIFFDGSSTPIYSCNLDGSNVQKIINGGTYINNTDPFELGGAY